MRICAKTRVRGGDGDSSSKPETLEKIEKISTEAAPPFAVYRKDASHH